MSRSNQTFRPPRVEPPRCFKAILCTGSLVRMFPLAWRPLMPMALKSSSKIMRRTRGLGFKVTLMTSASPLGLAVKYMMRESGVPCVTSYSRSRIMLVTAKRLI